MPKSYQELAWHIWTTKDPLGIFEGLKMYKFVGNSPVIFIDKWGLEWDLSRAGSLKTGLDKVKGTKAGKLMYDKIDDFKHTVSLVEEKGRKDPRAEKDEKGNYTIYIDPDWNPIVDEGEYQFCGSIARQIAHEMAHQVHGPSENKAVHYENLVAKELGEPQRYSY